MKRKLDQLLADYSNDQKVCINIDRAKQLQHVVDDLVPISELKSGLNRFAKSLTISNGSWLLSNLIRDELVFQVGSRLFVLPDVALGIWQILAETRIYPTDPTLICKLRRAFHDTQLIKQSEYWHCLATELARLNLRVEPIEFQKLKQKIGPDNLIFCTSAGIIQKKPKHAKLTTATRKQVFNKVLTGYFLNDAGRTNLERLVQSSKVTVAADGTTTLKRRHVRISAEGVTVETLAGQMQKRNFQLQDVYMTAIAKFAKRLPGVLKKYWTVDDVTAKVLCDLAHLFPCHNATLIDAVEVGRKFYLADKPQLFPKYTTSQFRDILCEKLQYPIRCHDIASLTEELRIDHDNSALSSVFHRQIGQQYRKSTRWYYSQDDVTFSTMIFWEIYTPVTAAVAQLVGNYGKSAEYWHELLNLQPNTLVKRSYIDRVTVLCNGFQPDAWNNYLIFDQVVNRIIAPRDVHYLDDARLNQLVASTLPSAYSKRAHLNEWIKAVVQWNVGYWSYQGIQLYSYNDVDTVVNTLKRYHPGMMSTSPSAICVDGKTVFNPLPNV